MDVVELFKKFATSATRTERSAQPLLAHILPFRIQWQAISSLRRIWGLSFQGHPVGYPRKEERGHHYASTIPT